MELNPAGGIHGRISGGIIWDEFVVTSLSGETVWSDFPVNCHGDTHVDLTLW